MRYSNEPRDLSYVKGHGFLSFAKNMGEPLSSMHVQKLLDPPKSQQKMPLILPRRGRFEKQQK